MARYRDIERMVTTGRGYSSATAAEAALKLAETSYLGARSYSGADLLHGPVAAIDDRTGVVAVTSKGHGGEAMRDVVETVRGRGAASWPSVRRRDDAGRPAHRRCPGRPRRSRRSWRSSPCSGSRWPCRWRGAATPTTLAD